MMNKPLYLNMANPSQTKDEADDEALAKWAALQIRSFNLNLTGRHTINDAVEKMKPAEQDRAKFWLNHFRKLAKQGEMAQ
ncbi:MAG: hypothetical protein WBH20_14820 [Oceanisphaera sp.]|uniref:hypothetical protein n=1 Tax=Oceanisphaera sp. TaxID=1929979 RepID=UPI003C75DF2B